MSAYQILGPLCGLLLILTGCSQQDGDAPVKPPLEVHAQQLQLQQSYPLTHRFVGRVYHPQTSDIGFESPGTVATIEVEIGQQVSAGQVLATLDTRLLRSEVQQLDAALAQNRADLNLTRTTLKRQLALSRQGYQSEQLLDELRSRQAQLQARQRQLEASLESVSIRLQKSILKAPYSGTVTRRQLTQDQVTGNGQVAFTLVPNGAAEARVGLPVRLLERLQTSQRWQASLDGRVVPVTLLGRSAQVDPATRTVALRFALPQERPLLNGQLLYLEVEERIAAETARVPLTALTAGVRGLWNLYILEALGDGSYQIARRDIRVLHADQTHAWISGAIDDGDRLVSTGLQRLVAGQRVVLASDPSITANRSDPK
ncbi:efflux RND transporter periplasmic adaptor subunit [Ferrimonas sediminicola]|uniref:Efflux RND transporter periplasmic adaptor subunit n=1 Tax=Ferrimonas sediminicola TaxID=2569538 RepID=A0A4U1BLC5_9GAMM|nr:efflux RND transporter periplasmic adaptor subunit [Ferrimonas sediminicola]TKB51604.1 efflux RND transporter periplasmic adaptor subunit [Ferrimonas sediminicola]